MTMCRRRTKRSLNQLDREIDKQVREGTLKRIYVKIGGNGENKK
jgi:hypothetical protein